MTWIYKSTVGLVAFLMVVTLAACPDEPVLEGQPGGGLQNPPPPPGGQVAPGAGIEAQVGTVDEGAGADERVAPAPDGQPLDDEGRRDAAKIPIAPLPPDVLTQREIEEGDFVKVKGTLSGDMCEGKQIRMEAMTVEDERPSLLTALLRKKVGAFEISVPKASGKVWLTAMCDVDGNNTIDMGTDFVAAFDGNPVKVDKDVTGITLKFVKSGEKPLTGMPTVAEGDEPPPE